MQSGDRVKFNPGAHRAEVTCQFPKEAPPYPGPPLAAPASHPNVQGIAVNETTVVHNGPFLVPTAVPAVVVSQPLGYQPMGYQPTVYDCKSCNHRVLTRIERRPSSRTHLFALCLCLIGCWPCACLPYCMDACNNADHYCTNCGTYIGSYIN
ncbi:lipopolysaccharide-induced tumor necrosis factor-alpha factor homolog [Battus philenor]|uniref:lipopolysaccharide-induced tumor necrosis factor-alpha factor homolog n=1 Tax=Battus philenor TaxID=42288 RepID=UPI0035CFFFC8